MGESRSKIRLRVSVLRGHRERRLRCRWCWSLRPCHQMSNGNTQLYNTHVTFDNFFSSVALLDYLHTKNIFATCTVHSSCSNLPVIAKLNKTMAYGESKWCTRNSVGYVKWKDTKVVHVMSTVFSPNTIVKTMRMQNDVTTLLVECPQSLMQYHGNHVMVRGCFYT